MALVVPEQPGKCDLLEFMKQLTKKILQLIASLYQVFRDDLGCEQVKQMVEGARRVLHPADLQAPVDIDPFSDNPANRLDHFYGIILF